MSQKATVSFVMSVSPSFYMYQRGSHWTRGSQTVLRGSLATSYQAIRAYIYEMATLKFTYFCN